MSIGVPIKVLHEAEGHIVTCETNTGEVYRGKLIEAEDNMNCQMSNITVTYRDGRVAQLEQVYIRGSKIRFLILPDMLKNAPMLKSMKNKNQGSGAGRGKAAILKAQGRYPPSAELLRTLFLLRKSPVVAWGQVSLPAPFSILAAIPVLIVSRLEKPFPVSFLVLLGPITDFSIKSQLSSEVWCLIPVIPALKRLRQKK